MTQTDQLAALIHQAQKIAVLTGAGISTESGIPDFRSDTGIYHFTSEEVFDIERFRETPQFFYGKIGPLCVDMLRAPVNQGHLALARLENEFGKDVRIATQNIDGLHQRAGSRHVYEVHGSLATLHCTGCGTGFTMKECSASFEKGEIAQCPKCKSVLKPDVTFYGEMLPEDAWENAERAFRECDLMLILGTSLAVYPAAALPGYAPKGTPMVIINKTATPLDSQATICFHDSISAVLGKILSE